MARPDRQTVLRQVLVTKSVMQPHAECPVSEAGAGDRGQAGCGACRHSGARIEGLDGREASAGSGRLLHARHRND